jgi:hypothetical protein
VAKKRREQEPGARLTKCSLTVAVTQQSWRSGNHYLGLFGAAAAPAPAYLAVRKSGAAHRSQYGQSTAEFRQRENRLARTSRYQTEFSKGLRVAEKSHNTIRTKLQRLIFRSPPLRTST